jgi:hypothetical protein
MAGLDLEALSALPADVKAMREEIELLRQQIEVLCKHLPAPLMDIDQFVEHYGISRSSVARRIRDNVLPHVRLEGRVLIDLTHFRAPDKEETARLAGRALRGL